MISEKIRNYVGLAAIVASFAFSFAVLDVAGTYSRSVNPSSYRSFSVTGKAEKFVTPDMAVFTFGVITEGGKNLDSVRDENSRKVSEIMDYLAKEGVDKSDIRTTEYIIAPRYERYDCPVPWLSETAASARYEACPPPSITGYDVRYMAEVKVREMSRAGEIAAGVSERGANSVSRLSFEVSEKEKIVDELRTEAIEDARSHAESVAKAGRFKLGHVISISLNDGYATVSRRATALSAEDTAFPPIEAGSQKIEAGVTVKYEIK